MHKAEKNSMLAAVKQHLDGYIEEYQDYFMVYRRDNTATARTYLEGLFTCAKGKANMERMEEEVEGSEYRRYQHFLSNSPWDH